MKDFLSFLLETIKIVILAIIIVFPIRYFVFQPFFVQGMSMEPNFFNSDYLIVDEITYRFRDPKRGEVIVFKYPQSPTQRYIKRIIGLPGETVIIKNGQITIINGNEKFVLDESRYLSDSYTSGEIKASLSGYPEWVSLVANEILHESTGKFKEFLEDFGATFEEKMYFSKLA